jgi:hypothetical protein
MTNEQEIRAKALELAIRTFGKKKIPFPPIENGGPNAIDRGLLMRLRLLEQYIREGPPDQTTT